MSDDLRRRLDAALGDRYRIDRELDRGGMAVVYVGEDLRHGREVAIKILQPVVAESFGAERFLREVDVIAKLQHPHVLTLIDSGDADGLPYYVMPLVKGMSLAKRLEAEGALPVEEAVRIASEIADALAYAHGHGVVHRDIKPANVLLSEGHAVVADFGIAGALEYAAASSLTRTGMSLGSPVYMSPEQATGDGEVDHRTDIYGLGCILYEMVAGERPLAGLSPQAALSRKILGDVPSVREGRPEVPARLAGVIAKAMAVDPDDRFGSAAEFRDALAEVLAARSPWAGKYRVAAGATAILGIAAFAVLSVALQRSQSATRVAERMNELERLVDAGDFARALLVGNELWAAAPEDSALNEILPRFTYTFPLTSEPAGATVFIRDDGGGSAEWAELGVTPIPEVRLAEGEVYRLRFELEDTRPPRSSTPSSASTGPWPSRSARSGSCGQTSFLRAWSTCRVSRPRSTGTRSSSATTSSVATKSRIASSRRSSTRGATPSWPTGPSPWWTEGAS